MHIIKRVCRLIIHVIAGWYGMKALQQSFEGRHNHHFKTSNLDEIGESMHSSNKWQAIAISNLYPKMGRRSLAFIVSFLNWYIMLENICPSCTMEMVNIPWQNGSKKCTMQVGQVGRLVPVILVPLRQQPGPPLASTPLSRSFAPHYNYCRRHPR